MSTVTLDASVRSELGKGAARKIRAAGGLPAVVYRAGDPATHVILDNEALELAFRRTQDRNTLVKLEIEGVGEKTCLVREAVRHPVSRVIQHVDFYEVTPGETVDVVVDVETKGTSKGAKMGGRLRVIRRDLTVRCKPADIPHRIVIDISPLEVGDFVRVSDLVPPAGCEFVYKEEFNVITILGKRGEQAIAELLGEELEPEGETLELGGAAAEEAAEEEGEASETDED